MAGMAGASSISVNFTPEANVGDVESGTAYGLIAVDGAYWNALTQASSAASSSAEPVFPAAVALQDNSGAATTATIAVDARALERPSQLTSYNPILRSQAVDYFDGIRQEGGWPKIQLSGIPYVRYNIYLYMTNEAWDRNGSVTVAIDSQTEEPLYYFMEDSQSRTSTVNTSWGNKNQSQPVLGENCLLIPSLEASSLVLNGYRKNSGGSSWRANICALQIVEIPQVTVTSDTTLDTALYNNTLGLGLDIINTGEGNVLTLNDSLTVGDLSFSGDDLTLKPAGTITAKSVMVNTWLTVDLTDLIPAVTGAFPRRIQVLTGALNVGEEGFVRIKYPEGFDETCSELEMTDEGVSLVLKERLPISGAAAISVNFGSSYATLSDQTGLVGGYPVDASRWIDTSAAGNTGSSPTTEIFSSVTDSAGQTHEGTKVFACSRGGNWTEGASTTLVGRLIRGYLDDSNGSNYAGFKVTGVPYTEYAVLIYCNGGVNYFPAWQVNGVYYKGNADRTMTVPAQGAREYWGARSNTLLTEGGNYLMVSGLTTPDVEVSLPVGSVPNGVRASISGFQIVDMGNLPEAVHYTATVSDPNVRFSEIIWDNGLVFEDGGLNQVTISFTEDATLTFDRSLSLPQITLKTADTLRLMKDNEVELNVTTWDLRPVYRLETISDANIFVPPLTLKPGEFLVTRNDTANPVTINVNQTEVYALMAGASGARAKYSVQYNGGALRIPTGFYDYTANRSTNQDTYLSVSGDADILVGGSFDVAKMTMNISGGTIRAEKFITTQGAGNSNTVNQRGGDIILSGTGDGSTTGAATLMFGHWSSGASNYNLSGGTIIAENGGFRLSNDSPVNFQMTGGRLQVTDIKGKGANQTVFFLGGGEVAIGAGGFDALGSTTFTLAGGSLTALKSNGIRMPAQVADATTSTLSALPGETMTLSGAFQGSGNLILGTSENTGTVRLAAAFPGLTGSVQVNGIMFDMDTYRLAGAMLSPDSTGTLRLTISPEDLASGSDALPFIGYAGAALPEGLAITVYWPDGITPSTQVQVVNDTENQLLRLEMPPVLEWTGDTDLDELTPIVDVILGEGAALAREAEINRLAVPEAGGTLAFLPPSASLWVHDLVHDGELVLDASGLASLSAYAVAGVPYNVALVWTDDDQIDTEKVTVTLPELSPGYEAVADIRANGVYLVITAPVFSTPSVSINFVSEGGAGSKPAGADYYGSLLSDDIRYGAYAVPGLNWNAQLVADNATAVSRSASVYDPQASGDAAEITVAQSNQRGSYGCNTVPLDFLKGYIDDGGQAPTPTLILSGLDTAFGEGAKYRVVFYASTDTAGAQFGYVTIGGVDYSARHGHTVKYLTTTWGNSRSTTPVEGDFHVISDILTGDEVIITAHRQAANIRGTIAAIQIIEVPDTPRQVPLYEPTVLADADWSALTWVDRSNNDEIYSGDWLEPDSMAQINATNADPVTLTVDTPVALAALLVKGSGDVTIQVADGASFLVDECDFSAHTGNLVIGFATGTANVTVGNRTALISGSGILTVDPGKMACLPIPSAWTGLIINNGTLRYTDSQTLGTTTGIAGGTVAFDDLTYTGSTSGFEVGRLVVEAGDVINLATTVASASPHLAADVEITGGTVNIASADLNNRFAWNSGGRMTVQTGGDVIFRGNGGGTTGMNGLQLGWTGTPVSWVISGGSLQMPDASMNFGTASTFTAKDAAQVTIGGFMTYQGRGTVNIDNTTLNLGANGVPGDSTLAALNLTNATFRAFETTAVNQVVSLSGANTFSAADGKTLTVAGTQGTASLTFAGETVAVTGSLLHAGETTVSGGTLLVEGTVGGDSLTLRHFRLTVTDWPRNNPNNNLAHFNTGVAIAALELTSGGTVLPWPETTSITALPTNTSTPSENEKQMIDNKYNTKYYTSSPSNGKFTFTIDRGTAVSFDGYRLLAADQDGRNPSTWTLEASMDGSSWVLIDSRTLPLAELDNWAWAGSSAETPGENQVKAFSIFGDSASDQPLRVASGAAIGGSGTISRPLVFAAGAVVKLNAVPSAGLMLTAEVTLPESGTVQIAAPASGGKHYLLKGEKALVLDKGKFTPPEGYSLESDTTGLFIWKRQGLRVILN